TRNGNETRGAGEKRKQNRGRAAGPRRAHPPPSAAPALSGAAARHLPPAAALAAPAGAAPGPGPGPGPAAAALRRPSRARDWAARPSAGPAGRARRHRHPPRGCGNYSSRRPPRAACHARPVPAHPEAYRLLPAVTVGGGLFPCSLFLPPRLAGGGGEPCGAWGARRARPGDPLCAAAGLGAVAVPGGADGAASRRALRGGRRGGLGAAAAAAPLPQGDRSWCALPPAAPGGGGSFSLRLRLGHPDPRANGGSRPRCLRGLPGRTKELDPVQKLFLDKIREYNTKSKQAGGPVDVGPEFQKDMNESLARLQRAYGEGDLTKFPEFKFEEPNFEETPK
uniref:ATP synthase peripheral stalk subunit F6, mitochondrial n=1 Tax=Accipiter nisus TaxID=211598 RepID=A0A8B9RVK5_9AVES